MDMETFAKEWSRIDTASDDYKVREIEARQAAFEDEWQNVNQDKPQPQANQDIESLLFIIRRMKLKS